MARKKSERKRGGNTAVNMLRGLILHRQGKSIRRAAKECNLPYPTLNRYIKKYQNVSTEELKNQRLTPRYEVNKIFTAEQEAELTAYIKECAKTKALSNKDVRKAAYELAAVNNIEAPDSWEREEMAGCDWLRSFKIRNFGPKIPEVPAVSTIEEVVKELLDGKKVVSLDRALKTLEVNVEREKADSNVVERENSSTLTAKLKTNTIDLVTGDSEMVILDSDINNKLEHRNPDLLLEGRAVPAGATTFDEDKTDNFDVKIETDHQLSSDEGWSRDPLSGKEDAYEEAGATVWSYYEREAGARARCVVCRAGVARADLRTHLKENHPKLVAEVDLVSDDEASDSQEDMYTEIVYLEDEQNANKPKTTPKLKHKLKPLVDRSEPRKRKASSSSDEAPLRPKKTKYDDEPENNEEIEQFGKYVTCLLKKIPPAACMELQAEIINLIMKKQLELKRNQTSLLAGTDKMAETAGPSRTEAFENTASTSSLNIIVGNGYSNATENKE